MATLSAHELAELVPCEADRVGRLVELGILAPGDDGRFPSSDVHVIRLMDAFEEAGIPLQDVARGVRDGDLTFPLGLFMPEPVGTPETYADLGARLGSSPEFLQRLVSELGLPPADDGRVRTEDAEMLSLILTRLDLADEDQLSRFARLYGGTRQRPLTAGRQFFDGAA